MTIPITADSPNGLPLVFVSGFHISYEKGGRATAPFYSNGQLAGMAVAYKDNLHPSELSMYWFGRFEVTYVREETSLYKSGTEIQRYIPDFIPLTFQSDGKKYQQLMPDGALAP